MRIIHRESYQRMPWKNGKGLTEEVIVAPFGSTMETFDWRLSIAHVGEDGPFSLFPGVDRSIALLDGEGLRLDLSDGDSTVLAPEGQPFTFAGEWAISSTNLGGPTIDLNIMTRRGRCQHSMSRCHTAQPLSIVAKAETILVFKTAAVVETSEGAITVAPYSSILLEVGEHISIQAKETLHLLMIELQPGA
jgi:uncharacterized protein